MSIDICFTNDFTNQIVAEKKLKEIKWTFALLRFLRNADRRTRLMQLLLLEPIQFYAKSILILVEVFAQTCGSVVFSSFN